MDQQEPGRDATEGHARVSTHLFHRVMQKSGTFFCFFLLFRFMLLDGRALGPLASEAILTTVP